jgi:hypothetical protein
VALPFDPDETWGAAQRHYVAGEVGGHRFRGVLEPTGLGFILPLGPAWRRDNGVAAAAPAGWARRQVPNPPFPRTGCAPTARG